MTECSICLEYINKEHKHETGCTHIFHKSCINKWLEQHNTCPNCRKELYEQKESEPDVEDLELLESIELLIIIQRQEHRQRMERQLQRQMERQRRRTEQRDERLMVNGGLSLPNGKVPCTH
jgi:hypothetical protein